MTLPLPYYLHRWGNPRDRPALLLHGFTGSGRSWAEAGPAFAGAGHFVLAPDLLGHGRSPAPADPERYGMACAAADLAALLNAEEIGEADLLGYSMGGRLALYFAVTYPARVRSLCLVSASPGLASAEARSARRARDAALADRIEREGVAAFVRTWELLPLWESQAKNLSQERRRRLRRQRLGNSGQGLANSLRGMGSGSQPDLSGRLPSLTVRTQLLAGSMDAKFVAVARRMQGRIPRSRLEVIPDTGHAVHLERPEMFARTVLALWEASGDGAGAAGGRGEAWD